jgi:hypothetical protein
MSDGDPRPPRPAARTSATSPTATLDQQRHARSAGPIRTPAASHGPTTPPDTSSTSPRQTSPSARQTLATKSPSKPGWLTAQGAL